MNLSAVRGARECLPVAEAERVVLAMSLCSWRCLSKCFSSFWQKFSRSLKGLWGEESMERRDEGWGDGGVYKGL